jgi:hypothetical protein
MSKVDPAFTPLVDENAATRRQRPRGPGYQGQTEKFRQNRLALAESLERDRVVGNSDATSSPSHPGDEKIDLDLCGERDAGFFDSSTAAATSSADNNKKHFRAIDNNIEEIERKMLMDAPKPLSPDEQYKMEDIFDQSYKDLLREDKTVVTSSIAKPATAPDDDEFDVF